MEANRAVSSTSHRRLGKDPPCPRCDRAHRRDTRCSQAGASLACRHWRDTQAAPRHTTAAMGRRLPLRLLVSWLDGARAETRSPRRTSTGRAPSLSLAASFDRRPRHGDKVPCRADRFSQATLSRPAAVATILRRWVLPAKIQSSCPSSRTTTLRTISTLPTRCQSCGHTSHEPPTSSPSNVETCSRSWVSGTTAGPPASCWTIGQTSGRFGDRRNETAAFPTRQSRATAPRLPHTAR